MSLVRPLCDWATSQLRLPRRRPGGNLFAGLGNSFAGLGDRHAAVGCAGAALACLGGSMAPKLLRERGLRPRIALGRQVRRLGAELTAGFGHVCAPSDLRVPSYLKHTATKQRHMNPLPSGDQETGGDNFRRIDQLQGQ